jgi:Alpha-L-arabinofuranosidase B (ABFB) domain
MNFRPVLRVLILAVAFLFPSLAAMTHAQGREASFKSWNFQTRYIRHRNSLGFLEEIRDRLGKKDASFRIVPGLAGNCSSLESMNYPGHYLRHQNFRIKLSRYSEDELFKKDATFCMKRGLANSSWTSFASFNLPDHYIRHANFQLWIGRFENTPVFRKDATFLITGPGGDVPID